MPSDGADSGKGPISAFRAFRLLRVFKLSKSWKKLQFLISTIARALKDISSFSVLLFLLIFIYVLLGMELFAKRSKSESIDDEPRNNFNNFFTGFILIFTVLTGENWDATMFQFAKTHGYVAIFFFISLIIIGVMIFLNLFLAILLDNFEVEDDEEDDPNQMSVMMKFSQIKASILERLSNKVNDILWTLHKKKIIKMKQDATMNESNGFQSSVHRSPKKGGGKDEEDDMSEKSSEHDRAEPEELDKGFKLRLVKSSMAQGGGENFRASDQLLIVPVAQKVGKSNNNSNNGLDSIIYEVSNSSKHSRIQDIGGLSPISKSPKQQYYNTQENFYTT
jgi:hypothetical protein